MIKITIDETGRDNLKDESRRFNQEIRTFKTTNEVKEYLNERYGRMPNMKKKIYIDDKNGTSRVAGFLHSYWNKDCSHNSKSWFQTDWVSFSEISEKPFDLNRLYFY